MTLKVGVIGKPNAGKSTFFSAVTGVNAAIGNYPFTTIEPNLAIGYFKVECPHNEIGNKCNPRSGFCIDGSRYVSVEIFDVPGLIEGASEGKGMGNQFLDSLREADSFIHLISPVDDNGKILSPHEIEKEAEMIEIEIKKWMVSRLSRDWEKLVRKYKQSNLPLEDKIIEKVSFFGIGMKELKEVLIAGSFPSKIQDWGDAQFQEFAEVFFSKVRPIVRVINKGDLLKNGELKSLKYPVISADYELSIAKAVNNSILSDILHIEATDKAKEKQKNAISIIRNAYASKSIMRAQDLLKWLIIDRMNRIVVYPVYDETKWTDKDGNVLPDAFVMNNGATAQQLAFAVHTEIGEGFIKAIDCRKKIAVGKNHELKNGDVIRIVSHTHS
ncbi:YchF-related putative GTPase [Caldiplasma sukawensis]